MTGPLIYVVDEPPVIAVVAVLVIESKLEEVVVNTPDVSVRLLETDRPLPNITPAELLITTPPLPINVEGNSVPVVCALLPLYCNVAAAP